MENSHTEKLLIERAELRARLAEIKRELEADLHIPAIEKAILDVEKERLIQRDALLTILIDNETLD